MLKFKRFGWPGGLFDNQRSAYYIPIVCSVILKLTFYLKNIEDFTFINYFNYSQSSKSSLTDMQKDHYLFLVGFSYKIKFILEYEESTFRILISSLSVYL